MLKNIGNMIYLGLTMGDIYSIVFYTFSFVAMYAQIFFFVTFLEKRKHIVHNPAKIDLDNYPTVTVVVPCYNEEKTIHKTVSSLLELDYPKDRLKLFLIDDGSKDNTWNIIKEFDNGSNIFAFNKPNGGKHTALNLALEKSDSEFFGCLDSDSMVHPQALIRMMKYFEKDPNTMAVAPSIIVHEPKNFLQKAQSVEYDLSIYTKKMLGFMGGIHVTPGPFSIFRKRVFDELGPYHKAHNTEDQEIALRMQEHAYKIDHCPDAYVYTIAPDTVPKLYRQRQRWIYGFINNLKDYRYMLFRKKYGAVALFTLPSGLFGVIGVIFLMVNVLMNLTRFVYNKIEEIQAIGFSNINWGSGFSFHFDWFFINTRAVLWFTLIMYVFVLISIIVGRKLAENKSGIPISVLYYAIVYTVIAPFWMLKAIYNTIISKESSWTFERRVAK